MLFRIIIILILCLPNTLPAKDREEERDKKMLELDRICEKARQKKMWPIKLKIFQDCMKEKKYKREEEEGCMKLAEQYDGQSEQDSSCSGR